jgi:hypothetical protein
MAKNDKHLLNDEELEEGLEFEGNSDDDSDLEKAKEMADKNDTEVTIIDDSGKEEENLTVTPNMDEAIINVGSLKSRLVSESRGELNLTEQEIMSILVNESEARMTKSELIEEIQRQILSEANMDDNIRRDLDRGTTDYSSHLDRDTVKNLADEMYNEIRDNLRQKGITNVNQAAMIMMDNIRRAKRIENQHKEELEQLAIKMVLEQFNVGEDEVEIEAHLVNMGDVNPGDIKYNAEERGEIPTTREEPPTQEPRRTSTPTERSRSEKTPTEPSGEKPKRRRTKEELKPEITKRRLMNAMMHGAGRKSQYMYHISDEVREIDPNLAEYYTNVMSGNDFVYWGMPDTMIHGMAQNLDQHAGNVRVEYASRAEGEPPKIIAQGITFPMLLHEIAKGMVEVLSFWGLPQDPEELKYVKGQTDHLQNETWDIRIGPKIWEKVTQSIPEEAVQYQTSILSEIFQLPAEDFNQFISGILNGRQEALDKLEDISMEVVETEKGYEYEDAMSQYSSEEDYEEDDETPTMGDESDVDDLLGGEEGEFDPSELSQGELDELIDQAIDDGDWETVKYLSQYKK